MKYEVLGNDKQADLNLYVCERDDKIAPGVRYGPVIRDSYIIECCTEGSGSITINGKDFPLKPGDCMVLLPGDIVTHITSPDTTRSGVWCAVKGIKISSYLDAVGIDSKNPYAPRKAVPKIVELINRIIELKADTDAGADLRRTALVHEMFGEIMRYAKTGADKSAYIRQAIRIIETRYAEQITVAGLAHDIGLDRSYFSTVFHKVTGMSPQEYITDIRIKKACALLSMEEYTISEAACAVGIAPEGFSRVFKGKTGITPGQYRQKQKQVLPDMSEDWICGR